VDPAAGVPGYLCGDLRAVPSCTPYNARRRYQKAYRELAKKHPGFRERSETTELIVEISLQPYNSFKPDGVILFRWVQ
jgi:uroporphyrinogen-III decarboxylase